MDQNQQLAVVRGNDGALAERDFVGQWASAADIAARKKLLQEVMEKVMVPNVHYGTLPGAKKPMLYKAGAEAACTTFGIAPEYKCEDLGDYPHLVRYRVTCRGISQGTGLFLGEGLGECASEEESKKWRDVVMAEEYDATPDDQRREKWTRERDKSGAPIVRKQVRQYPPDMANAILKMAKKRAYVDMVLSVTGASDIFDQDLEDLTAAGTGVDVTTGTGAAAAGEGDRKAEARASKAVKAVLPGAFVVKAAAAAAVTPAPNPAPIVTSGDAVAPLATQDQCRTILRLLGDVGAPRDAIDLILAREGVADLTQMAGEKIEGLAAQLRARLEQQNQSTNDEGGTQINV